jgi:hypothetical protein
MVIRHLLHQAIPTALPAFSDVARESRMTIASFENDPQQLVAGQFYAMIAEIGASSRSSRLSTFWLKEFLAEGALLRPQQPGIVLRGQVEQLVLAPIGAARLRLRVMGTASGESSPRFDRTIDVALDEESFSREQAEGMIWVIPRWVPQIGGTIVPLDQKTLAILPILAGLLGATARRSGSVWLFSLYLAGLLAAAFFAHLSPPTQPQLLQHVLWSVVVVGAVVFTGCGDWGDGDVPEDNPACQRYPRLVAAR